MTLRVSRAQAKHYGITVKSQKPVPRERFEGYASQWERDYAAYLAQDARVLRWQYEAIRLILAPRTTYLPDFLVTTTSQELEIHEVKGFWREKDRIKVKIAARLFPMFRFVGVRKVHGLWEYERFKG